MKKIEMSDFFNHLGQPVGEPVQFDGAKRPMGEPLIGRYVKCVRLDPSHSKALSDNYALNEDGSNFTYLSYLPFENHRACHDWIEANYQSSDPLFYCFLDAQTNEPIGMGAFMRIAPDAGSIEIGHLNFSPKMQGTRMSTQAMFLMMQHAFDLGYRRYEWKCNALNMPSRKAAERLSFQYEGTFRQALVCKGHNRDTAWFSIIDKEWPALKARFETWLDPNNFDDAGKQIKKL